MINNLSDENDGPSPLKGVERRPTGIPQYGNLQRALVRCFEPVATAIPGCLRSQYEMNVNSLTCKQSSICRSHGVAARRLARLHVVTHPPNVVYIWPCLESRYFLTVDIDVATQRLRRCIESVSARLVKSIARGEY